MLLLFLACTRAHLALPDAPTLAEPRIPPSPPAAQVRAAELTPKASTDLVGGNPRLAGRTVGLLPLAEVPPLGEVGDAVLDALLRGGFDRVVDLRPGEGVLASWGRSGGDQLRMLGRLPDVAQVAPVARADVLLRLELVDLAEATRDLPVTWTYDAASLAAYDGEIGGYLGERSGIVAALVRARDEWLTEFDAAVAEYVARRPWWQRVQETIDPPHELGEGDRLRGLVGASLAAMPERVPTGAELAAGASARQEARAVTVHSARLRVTATDGRTGQLLVVAEVAGEATDLDDLRAQLATATVAALGAR